MVSRRRLLELGALGGGAMLLPVANAFASPTTDPATPVTGHGHAGSTGRRLRGSEVSAAAFTVPMPIPATLQPVTSTTDTDYYQLDVQRIRTEIIPGLQTTVLAFGGSFIGPTIKARKGRRVVVTQTNRIDQPISVHLHGGHVSAGNDGHPMDMVDPGAQKVYTYPNQQPAATLWYHDHVHGYEAEHLYRGLAGFYLIEDPNEATLRLPSGEYDVPIMLRDAKFAADGSMEWALADVNGRDTVLVNGRPQPYFQVAARKYRFRLLNASNMREFELRLANTVEFAQVGSDGGLLPAPYRTQEIRLSPGERKDVVVDFSAFPLGTQLVLENTTGLSDASRWLLRFDVTRTASDSSLVPSTLAPAPQLPPATTTRTFTLARELFSNRMQINGRTFDPNRVDVRIPLGSTEIWEIRNGEIFPPIPHNFHVHLVQFKVLSRNGNPPTADEAGWKDTVPIGPGQNVRVQATFANHTGRFVYHCHFVDHAAEGMMGQMEIY